MQTQASSICKNPIFYLYMQFSCKNLGAYKEPTECACRVKVLTVCMSLSLACTVLHSFASTYGPDL